jgi:hypothetical protein
MIDVRALKEEILTIKNSAEKIDKMLSELADKKFGDKGQRN